MPLFNPPRLQDIIVPGGQVGDIGIVTSGGRFGLLHKSGKKGAQLREGEVSGNLNFLLPSTYNAYDRGCVVESFRGDMGVAAVGQTTTIGTVFWARCRVTEQDTISNVGIGIVTFGAALANCYQGIYQWSGSAWVLSAATADLSTSWGTTGQRTNALVGAPITVAAGEILVAWLVGTGTTTSPTFARGTGTNTPNTANGALNLATATYGTADTARATLPATLGAMSITSNSFWVLGTR